MVVEAPMGHYKHPEIRSNEFYLGNFTCDSFKDVGYKSKRAGYMAFDLNRNPINDSGLFPVFVDKIEYSEVQEGYKLMGGIEINA